MSMIAYCSSYQQECIQGIYTLLLHSNLVQRSVLSPCYFLYCHSTNMLYNSVNHTWTIGQCCHSCNLSPFRRIIERTKGFRVCWSRGFGVLCAADEGLLKLGVWGRFVACDTLGPSVWCGSLCCDIVVLAVSGLQVGPVVGRV